MDGLRDGSVTHQHQPHKWWPYRKQISSSSKLFRLAQRQSFRESDATVSALRRLFDDITRHAGIGVTDSVENHIEWDLCAIRIAAFARFNQSFGFVQDCSVDKDYVFCCSGAGSKKSRGIALLSPTVSFASVFNLRFLDRLPLHI
jgi:hypothetical protein